MANENGTTDGSELERNISASASFKSKWRKNIRGNRTMNDIGWKYGTDVDDDSRRVKCSFCTKVIYGGIYRFKHHLAGTEEDCGACALVSDEAKVLMLKWYATCEEATEKKRKMAEITQTNRTENSILEIQISQPQQKGKRKPSAFVPVVQTKIDAIVKKTLKVEADEAIVEFFYSSVIPFNCIRNLAFAKMCEAIGKYGFDFKPPSYRDINDKLLVRVVDRTHKVVDYMEEWKTFDHV